MGHQLAKHMHQAFDNDQSSKVLKRSKHADLGISLLMT
jgi:hypothetical protein